MWGSELVPRHPSGSPKPSSGCTPTVGGWFAVRARRGGPCGAVSVLFRGRPLHYFISPSDTCEGTQVEGLLGWASEARTSETPRPLRRCYNTAATTHFHWLDEHCPALPNVQEEAILGCVR